MPRVEELPPQAQKQIRASRGEPDLAGGEKRTLLQRLATVGFGRRDDAPPAPEQVVTPAPVAVEPAPRPAVSPIHADYAKRSPSVPAYRPAQGNLDPQGRVTPAPRPMDDEQLEIPAFLRRQSN
jgi:cell division protein FtsZ